MKTVDLPRLAVDGRVGLEPVANDGTIGNHGAELPAEGGLHSRTKFRQYNWVY